MIRVENIQTYGWEAAIRGMRNPKNSWDKSDSKFPVEFDLDIDGNPIMSSGKTTCVIGENDLSLMKKLVAAGTDHSKFMRMIGVSMDITAPLYFDAELDTYKVGTVRNSCSFMHKGVSKPFDITDFSVHDDRIYEILTPREAKKYPLVYKFDTDEYKEYTCGNGRKYKVYRNGRVFSERFEYTDSYGSGRHWEVEEKECIPSITTPGYYDIRLGGRNGERWLLHRLVATLWCENPNNYTTVNHIDGDKGNNSADNLEWCSIQENIRKGFEANLYENCGSLGCLYKKWKNSHTVVDPLIRSQILSDHRNKGMTCEDISDKYGITVKQAKGIVSREQCENADLFSVCYSWEKTIDTLNGLRDLYLESKDDKIFQMIRCILPSGYNQRFTMSMNYAVLRNMYHARKNHRLDEWRLFCKIMEGLPYSELITM